MTFCAAVLTPSAAPLIADPADDVTLDKPSEAFEVAFDAASLDFAAVFAAVCEASAVVEACRRAVRRVTNRLCRSTNPDVVVDMKKSTFDRAKSIFRTKCGGVEASVEVEVKLQSENTKQLCRKRAISHWLPDRATRIHP